MSTKAYFNNRGTGTVLWTVAIVFFLGGPLLGLLAGIVGRVLEDQVASKSISDYVFERSAVLKKELFVVTEALYHTRALFNASTRVTRDDFRRFTQDVLARHRIIAAVEWIPRVVASEQASHERSARAEGLDGYRIWARNAKGELEPSPPKASYFPIWYREPMPPGGHILGLDLSSDAARNSVLKLAEEKNEFALTDPITLLQEPNRAKGFLVVLPVYGPPDASKESGSRTVRGMIGIVVRARELFLKSLQTGHDSTAPEIFLELMDDDVNGKPALIASSSEENANWRGGAYTFSTSMELGEQRWHLRARPSQAFIDTYRTSKPVALGIGVCLFWELLGAVAFSLSKRSHDTAFRAQSLLYESALQSLTEGVVVANTDGRFVLFNAAAEKILGIGLQDVQVTDWSATYGCFLPDTITPFPPQHLPLARALKGERVIEELFIRSAALPEGVWILSSGAPMRDPAGTLVGGVVNFRDISTWKRASESLRLSVKELTELKYAVDQASIVSITSIDGNILYANDKFLQTCGYAADELLGNSYKFLNSGYHTALFFQELWTQIGSCAVWRGVIRNRAKNGEFYWVDTTIVALLDEAGQCERYLSISKDITASKLQEQDLLLLSNAVEQTADAIFITDSRGTITYVNPGFEAITGFSLDDARGKTPRILKSGTNSPRYYEDLWRTILGGKSFRSLTINRKKNGRLFETEQTITPIKDSAGNITDFVSVIKDITDRVMRQRQEIEMRYACQVQQQLYPAQSVEIHGYDIAGTSFPAEFACGDYYDYLEPRAGSLCLALGDVSGHGLAPAMIMTATRSYLRFLLKALPDLRAVMRGINDALYADLERSRFVALLVANIDLATRRLVYVNAGMTPGFVLDKTGAVKAELSNCGPPLGLLPDINHPHGQGVSLEDGDIVVLMTDGVTEAQNGLDEFFEVERALAVVRDYRHEPAKQLVERLHQEVQKFSQDTSQKDDITAIVCKVGAGSATWSERYS